MSRFHTRIEVPRGILETFAFVSDFSHAGRWDPNVQSASMLTPEPIGLASMFSLVGRLTIPFTNIKPPLIGEFTLPYQVVAFDPPPETLTGSAQVTARVRLEGQSAIMRYVDTITFTGNAAATTLDYDALLELIGPLRIPGWFLPRFASWVGASATKGMRDAILNDVPAPRAPDAKAAPAEARTAP